MQTEHQRCFAKSPSKRPQLLASKTWRLMFCGAHVRLCHLAGGELEQIQFLLGHVFIQTTERYLAANKSCDLLSTTRSVSNRDGKGRITRPFLTYPANLCPLGSDGPAELLQSRPDDAMR
jgi:hypothetical protein